MAEPTQYESGETQRDWFCPKCGTRNTSDTTACQTCKEVGNEINTDWAKPHVPSADELARGRSIARVIVLVFVLCAAGASYLGIKGYAYLQAQTHSEKAYALHQKGEMKEAIEAYDQVLKYDPDNAWALSNRASASFYVGEFESADRDYTRAMELGENSAEHIGYRGTCRMQMGKYRAAVLDYERAKVVGPHNPEILRGLMYCQYNLGNLDSALAYADTLSSDEKMKSNALSMQAYVCWERGEVDRAESLMREAASLNSDDIGGSLWLACILAKSKPAEADKLWKEAFEKAPDNIQLSVAYGEYLLLVKGESANTYFENALKAPAVYLEDYQSRYLALCALGRADEAQQIVSKLESAAVEARWMQFSLAVGQLFLARKSTGRASSRYQDKAVDYLEKAFALGLKNWKTIGEDWILPDLKEHPRYQKLRAAP